MGLSVLVVLVLALLVAVVLVTGVRAGALAWERVWGPTGAALGLGFFALYLIQDPASAFYFPIVGTLFVGAGIAATAGTLFLPRSQPALRELSRGTGRHASTATNEAAAVVRAEWADRLDELRPSMSQWLNHTVFLLPGIGLIYLGIRELFHPLPIVLGAVSVVAAGVGVADVVRRTLRARHLVSYLEDPDAPPSTGMGQ